MPTSEYWRRQIEMQLRERRNAFRYPPYGEMDAMQYVYDETDYTWAEIAEALRYQREIEDRHQAGDHFGARQLWIVARAIFPDMPDWFFNYRGAAY